MLTNIFLWGAILFFLASSWFQLWRPYLRTRRCKHEDPASLVGGKLLVCPRCGAHKFMDVPGTSKIERLDDWFPGERWLQGSHETSVRTMRMLEAMRLSAEAFLENIRSELKAAGGRKGSPHDPAH